METISWDRCFICSSKLKLLSTERQRDESLVCQNPSENRKSVLTHKMLFKYLVANCQDSKDVNERERLVRDIVNLESIKGDSFNGASSLMRFCSFCEQLSKEVKSLHLQLEVTQMKLIEKLKIVKQCVINNSRLYGSNAERLEQKGYDDDVLLEKERTFLDVQHRFQTVVFESDILLRNIPLVYLKKYMGGYGQGSTLECIQDVADNDHVKMEEETVTSELCDYEDESDSHSFLETTEGDFQFKNESLTAVVESPRRKRGTKRKAVSGSGNKLSAQIKNANRKFKKATGKKTRISSRATTISATKRFNEVKPETILPKTSKLRIYSEAQNLARNMKADIKAKKISEPKNELNRKKRGLVICEECSFETNVAPRMEQHFMEHEDTLDCKYECPECKKRFKRYQYFEFHVTHYCGSLTWRCDICAVYIPRQDMKEHVEKIHGSNKLYPCDHCSFLFASFPNLVIHCEHHNRADLKYCWECDNNAEGKRSKFVTRQQLLRHLHEDHGHDEIALKCNYENCSATFYKTSLLQGHKYAKHEQRFACDQCGKAFENKSAMDWHHNVKHKKDKPFRCEQCPQEFSTKISLDKHLIKVHHVLKYKCELCPERIFTEDKSLKCHMKKEHGIGELEYIKCRFCSKTFLRRDRLKQHEAYHTDKRDFTCEVCGFATKTKGLLRCHMAKHAEDKKYACSYCPKTFAVGKYLKDHLRIHTLERPWQCDLCGSTFNQQSALKVHKKKHSDGNSFVPKVHRLQKEKAPGLADEASCV